MQHTFSLLSLVLFTLFVSCDKDDELTQFSMDYNSTVVFQASSGFGFPVNLITPRIESNSTATFQANNTRAELVEKIRLQELKLTLEAPSDADFSFLESVEVYLSAPGLPEIFLASEESIGGNVGRTLTLTTTREDLQEYIKAESFSIRVFTVATEILRDDHEIKVEAEFFVDAKIFGV